MKIFLGRPLVLLCLIILNRSAIRRKINTSADKFSEITLVVVDKQLSSTPQSTRVRVSLCSTSNKDTRECRKPNIIIMIAMHKIRKCVNAQLIFFITTDRVLKHIQETFRKNKWTP